jgi:hypothetical protein
LAGGSEGVVRLGYQVQESWHDMSEYIVHFTKPQLDEPAG